VLPVGDFPAKNDFRVIVARAICAELAPDRRRP
jgi:hypothetical protein